jgi:RNA polymerase sigma factor (sigma-70 family)
MKQGEPPTPEEFHAMLAWLDPSDEERAARRYEQIRSALLKILARRSCPSAVAEELVDITFNRVAKKDKDVAPTYVGDPAAYFYAVALNVYKEFLRDVIRTATKVDDYPPPDGGNAWKNLLLDCIDECKEKLVAEDRELIENYYLYDGRKKIEHRQELAERYGITVHALRMRASRIRKELQKCALERLEQKEAE